MMSWGMIDFEQEMWRVGRLGCACNECKSFYAAGWAEAKNREMLEPSPYGTIS
jgi:hypothetical protein